jgi:selenocysteine lyase/cysteine desulfurase
MRPLRFLASQGVDLTVVPCSDRGEIDPDDIRAVFRANTRAVVLTHASNVTGTIMPIQEIGALTRTRGDIVLCVDAAQTAGALPIDAAAMGVDLLAFTGHKSLFGPQGTGGLYIRKGLDEHIGPLMRGGTGSRSEFEEQPDFMPDKYECGTPNTIGLAGLGAGAAYILAQGLATVREKEEVLTRRFLDHLQAFDGDVTLYGPRSAQDRIPLISFNIRDISPSDAALYLDEKWGILCRPGLHCAPAAHRTIGTFPQGTVRFSFGFFNTEEQVDLAAEALRNLLDG